MTSTQDLRLQFGQMLRAMRLGFAWVPSKKWFMRTQDGIVPGTWDVEIVGLASWKAMKGSNRLHRAVSSFDEAESIVSKSPVLTELETTGVVVLTLDDNGCRIGEA